MKNLVCDALGIRYPVFQGAMQWVSNSSLVIAVSEAGGLGILATANRPKEEIRAEIRAIREKTDKPFAVNVPMQSSTCDEIAALLIEEGVQIAVTAAGNPERLIGPWKAAGIKILSVVGSVRQAVKMEQLGADIIVAEGQEGGGHIGEMTTIALVPQVVRAVSLPVVAAGGIADGRGMAAAFLLGASGIQMGTAFLPCTECTVHENFKKAILESDSGHVVVTGRRTGDAVRCLHNALAEGFRRLDAENAPREQYVQWGTGSLRRAVVEGDVEMGTIMVGQIVGLVNRRESVAGVIRRVIGEYNEIVRNPPLREIAL